MGRNSLMAASPVVGTGRGNGVIYDVSSRCPDFQAITESRAAFAYVCWFVYCVTTRSSAIICQFAEDRVEVGAR